MIVAGPHVRNECARHLRDMRDGHLRGLRFDRTKAERAIRFFPSVLRLNGGQFEGLQFHLQPAQQFIVGSIYGWVRIGGVGSYSVAEDGLRRFRVVYIEKGKGNGKAISLDTEVPTPSGWATMGDLCAGDWVLDDAGRPCQVIQAHAASNDRECYRMEFDDGQVIIASAEHLWATEARWFRALGEPSVLKGVKKCNWGRWRHAVRTTSKIAETLRYANGKYQSCNHSVALSKPLDLPEVDLPIEPYLLGIWLGDGDSDCARITIGKQDAHEMTRSIFDAGHICVIQKNNRYLVRSLQVKLRKLRLLNNKHIPDAYLRASLSQRQALLQGLMDTDGYIDARGCCEFTQVKKNIADRFLELAISLGLKASMIKGDAKIDGRYIGPKYRVQFHPRQDQHCFRLPRKLERQATRHTRRRLSADRKIVACDRVSPVPVRCITVNSPTSMFLVGRSMIPTHNSPMVAGIGLLGLIADNEPRAEIYSAASKKDQAAILFRDAVAMVKQSPALKGATTLSGRDDKVWNIFHPGSDSFFRPISSEQGQSGPRPHVGLIDELHEHRDGTVINMMSAGRKWRRQPLIIAITNSGTDRNSVCWEYHQMGVKISAGVEHDDTFFSYICSLDAEDDPFTDESCWIKANPLLGPILTHQYLRDEVNQARGMPSKESTVRRLNFCQWTEAHNPAFDMDIWDQCATTFGLSDFSGMTCKIGLDLSGTVDLTAAVFEFSKDGKFWLFPMFWIPEDIMLEKAKIDHAPYAEWKRAGFIKTTPGKAINKDHVVKDIAAMMTAAHVTASEVVYDRWFINEFVAAADRQGVTFTMVECGQGFKDMSPAIKEFETSLVNDEIRHNGNPCLRWAAASAVQLSDPAGNKKYDKAKATGRIDGIVAATMAHSRAVLHRPQPEPQIRWL